MADFSQVPGELNISVGYGDELALALDFDISLTGYTFVAKVVTGIDTEEAFVVSGTNLASGQLSLFMTESQIQSLYINGKQDWYLEWTPPNGVGRRPLAGYFEIKKYPP